MILPMPEDAIHRFQLYRLLTEILDDPLISHVLLFKGGTCASMLGYLDRFSVDLDFDLKNKEKKLLVHKRLLKIFLSLDLKIKSKSNKELFYVLNYKRHNESFKSRNALKLGIIDTSLKSNTYKAFYLREIDRYALCQTVETMFANKLVALTDRYEKHSTIAGRDLYDIHHFFIRGYKYRKEIIIERTGLSQVEYLVKLKEFIENKITDRIITQDLGSLLSNQEFQKIRKNLKKETLLLLKNEINSI